MINKTSRRTFLLATGLSGASLYFANWWFTRVRSRDYSDILLAVLYRHLGHLKTRDGDFERFASEFPLTYRYTPLMPWAGLAAPVYSRTGIAAFVPGSARFRRFEEDVVSAFLLSTDFFWRGADETRELVYAGFYDPYYRPCQNPFAQLS